MFRYIALALMLSPGVAHAQKFVTVGDETAIPTITAEVVDATTETVGDIVEPATDDASAQMDDVAVLDYAALGNDVVFDGASIEEIEALLAGADASALAADEQNAIITRVQTDDNGGSVLAIDVSGSDQSSTQATGETQSARLEIGECNEGTNWITDDINCFNAYPTDGE